MFTVRKKVPNHQLFYFELCVLCLRTRFALWLMGIKLHKKDILKDPANKAELIAGGGKKQVPCLRIDKGSEIEWLYESAEIINYFKNGDYLLI